MARTYVGGGLEDTNFQKAVAGETELRGKALTTYHSTSGIRKYRYLFNAHTASRSTGLAAFYDLTGTTYRGLEVANADAANIKMLAGIHVETVTSGVWGWVQTEGYYPNANTRKYGSASNKNQTAGSYLIGLNGVDALCSDAAATCEPTAAPLGVGFVRTVASQASHSDTSSTTTTQAVYIFGAVR